MDVDGTCGAQSAKKYIWENVQIECHDSASPDMDDTDVLLSFLLTAPKRTCIRGPRPADQASCHPGFCSVFYLNKRTTP